VSRIFDSKSSSTIPSNSPKVNIHLKKGVGKLKFRSEPENTELKSGPEKADSDPVSKSQESKRTNSQSLEVKTEGTALLGSTRRDSYTQSRLRGQYSSKDDSVRPFRVL
jgi:catalase